MPEIAIDKDGNPLPRECNIGTSGYPLVMFLEMDALGAQITENNPLRFCVLGSDFRHYLAAFFFGEYIHPI
jgi:hypothetical protein